MRPWLALAVLSIACVAWLALRGGKSGGGAPTSPAAIDASAVEREPPPASDAESRRVLDPGPAAGRAVAEETLASATDPRYAALSVRAVLPDGSPWVGGTLEIEAQEPVVELHDSPRSTPSTGLRVAVYDGRTHRLQVETDAAGRAVFEPIVPGVAVSLRAFDDLDTTGALVPPFALAAGERRELELACAATAPLRGRCVDEHGAPLAGVDVHVARGDWSLIAPGDGDGRFATTPLFARAVTLRARLARRAACERSDVDPAAGPVELTLQQGRSLLVETFDVAGELVAGPQPTIHLDGDADPLPAAVARVRTGWQFSELPGGPLTLRWDAPCRPRTQSVEADATQVRVLEEPLGRLVVEVAPRPHDPDVEHYVSILCAGSTTPAVYASLRGDRVQELDWDLAPGHYQVQRYATSSLSPGPPRPIGSTLLVEVRANETTLERLDD